MERNITRMADFARKHQVLWRPHAKAHKCAELALWLQRAGATGACVQKTAEAETLAAGGVHDITITNEVIALPKLLRLARLAARLQAQGGRLTLAVDSADGIHRLAEAMAQAAPQARIGVLVEIDVGQGRCGVPPGEPALALAHTVARQARLHFAGLHAYQGRAQHLHSAAERRDAIAAVVQAARRTRDLIAASGLAVPLVTGSGTGTLVHEAASGVFGELQAARSCSWTRTMHATSANPRSRLSSMPCSSRPRSSRARATAPYAMPVTKAMPSMPACPRWPCCRPSVPCATAAGAMNTAS